VIVIDGDGSILTNLGTLPTIGNNAPSNYILMIIDNGSYGSTGDQPTYTSQRTDLTGMARAAGCARVVEVQDVDTGPALEEALASGEATVMVVKCDSGNAKMPVITMDPVVICDRFMKAVAS
jgi:sulfopyruvate decarboxylase subunit beta